MGVPMIRRFLLPVLLLTLADSAIAGVLVNRSQIDFAPSRSREDVLISNPGKEKVFLEVNVLEVRNAGTPDEKWEPNTDPATVGLVAAPRRITIPPGGQRMVRLVNVGGIGDKERIYRLHVNPVAGGADDIGGKGLSLKVMVGYQLLVVIPPKQPIWSFDGQRAGTQLLLTNTGRSNVFFYDGKQCDGLGDCVKAETLRLYPGNTRVIELQRDAPVSYSITTGDSTTVRTFP